jgi:hypothetical protein
MEPRASYGSSITSAKHRAEGSVLQRAPMAGTFSSTGANIARRSVLHPGGELLGRSDIFTCRVADMGEGERALVLPASGTVTSVTTVTTIGTGFWT